MQQQLNLYEQDFYAWTQEQEKYLREKSFNKLDLVHLSEELHLMGASEKRELAHRLEILLAHLLKWKYQSSRQCKSWVRTIKIQRLDLIEHLKNNPSLKTNVNSYLDSAYEKAILFAADETNLDEDIFPQKCEWLIEQVLDKNFLPI